MALLSDNQIASALNDLPGWERSGNALTRSFRFPDFASAMRFVNQVAEAAESADHHPDIDIRFNRVELSLSSHDRGGITSRDVKMAGKINAIAAGPRP